MSNKLGQLSTKLHVKRFQPNLLPVLETFVSELNFTENAFFYIEKNMEK